MTSSEEMPWRAETDVGKGSGRRASDRARVEKRPNAEAPRDLGVNKVTAADSGSLWSGRSACRPRPQPILPRPRSADITAAEAQRGNGDGAQRDQDEHAHRSQRERLGG